MTDDLNVSTPPTPSGLVDAGVVREYLAAEKAYRLAFSSWNKHETSKAVRDTYLSMTEARATLDATLSGQQGGAVPAGDLRNCPFCGSTASKGYRDAMNWCGCTNCECTVMPQAVDYVSDEALVNAWNTRARLAEQPAPARTGNIRFIRPCGVCLTPENCMSIRRCAASEKSDPK